MQCGCGDDFILNLCHMFLLWNLYPITLFLKQINESEIYCYMWLYKMILIFSLVCTDRSLVGWCLITTIFNFIYRFGLWPFPMQWFSFETGRSSDVIDSHLIKNVSPLRTAHVSVAVYVRLWVCYESAKKERIFVLIISTVLKRITIENSF